MRAIISCHGKVLDVGSGGRRLGENSYSFDIVEHSSLDVRGDACQMPFRDQTFDLVVCTSVLEHVSSYSRCVQEIVRVTTDTGELWLEVPFLYHFHTSGPSDDHDYTRWTQEGVKQLLHEFEIIEIGANVGPGTVLRLTIAEVISLCFWHRRHSAPYYWARLILGYLFYPLSWLDRWLSKSTLAHRASGGFYVYARKRPNSVVT